MTGKTKKKASATSKRVRLGIDMGTTRTVVAIADRGNYPIVTFEDDLGDARAWFPALIAARNGEVRYGFDAEVVSHQRTPIGDAGSEWSYLRSLKRLLADASPETVIELGGDRYEVSRLLVGYLAALRSALVERSNLEVEADCPIDAWVSVPANANSNQRFLTVEAFRAAGFTVDGVLNEPSAAGIEFVHRFGQKKGLGKKQLMAVYDLGGGTFDVSIISVEGDRYEVLTGEGVRELGGSDFDEALLELALEDAGVDRPTDSAAIFHLLEECRERKEGLHPNTRKIVVDLGRGLDGQADVIVQMKRYDDKLSPMIERTITALETALDRTDRAELGAVYLVGGASALPAVSRLVKRDHGRKVRRSPYPHAATAVGLAVAGAREAEVSVQERFTRNFGVWREAEDGRRIVFDPIFEKDTRLPAKGKPPLTLSRCYRPAHNIAHFRYLECSGVGSDDCPAGDLNPWDDVYFPMDPSLADSAVLSDDDVAPSAIAAEQLIEEEYVCDETGAIEVTIRNRTAGYAKTYRLRQGLATLLKSGRKKAARAPRKKTTKK